MKSIPSSTDRGLVFLRLLFAAACLWIAAYHLFVNILPYEDAWITYRFADNIASGQGWAANPGEPVQGCTSPLYTLWIAAGRILLPDSAAAVISVRGNMIFYILTAWLLGRTVGRLAASPRMGAAAATLFALNPGMIALSSGGKEMFLFTALSLAALDLAGRGRFVPAALLGSLSLLARPEGALVAIVVAGLWWRAGRPQWRAILAAFALPAGAWACFALVRFGHLLPQPLIAKLWPVYPVLPGSALFSLARWLGDWTAPVGFSEGSLLRNGMAFTLAELGALGLIAHRETRARGGGAVALLLQLFLLFYSLGNPLLFDWYLAGVFIFWLPAILIGIPALASLTPPAFAGTRLIRFGASAVAWGVLITGIAVPLAGDALLGRNPMDAARSAIRLRCKAYREAAAWLNGIAGPGSTLASPESGALGSVWTGRMLDTSGLISPEALSFLPVPEELRPDPDTGATPISIPVELIRQERPDYIAVLEVFAEKTLLRDQWFKREYRTLRKFLLAKPLWGSGAVYVMQRVDLPPPSPEDEDEAGATGGGFSPGVGPVADP